MATEAFPISPGATILKIHRYGALSGVINTLSKSIASTRLAQIARFHAACAMDNGDRFVGGIET
jgi:hypothetical protein